MPEHEAEDGEQRMFWGSPQFPRPFTAVYRKVSRTWERDDHL